MSASEAARGLAGEGFRRDVLDTWELTDPERRLLDQAAAVLDAIVALDAQVARDGTMVDGSKGQQVLHPAIAEARQQRLAFGRLLGQLNLPHPDEDDAGTVIYSPQSARGRRAAQARWKRQRGSA